MSRTKRDYYEVLEVERSVKRLQPQMAPWADGSSQQFPATTS